MEPLYQKVKTYVMDGIQNRSWGPGHRLPSENELVRRLGVSRMTVNRALRELTEQGLISRIAGVGTFVAPARQQRTATPLRDIADEVAEFGQRHRALVLERGSVDMDEALAGVFGVRAGGRLFHLVCLHRADDIPVLLEERWIHPEIAPDFPDADLEHTTATRYLLETAPLQRVEQVVEAIAVDDPAAGHLDIDRGSPVLLIRRRTWTDDRVASYAHLYYPGQRYRLVDGAEDLPRLSARFQRRPETHGNER